MKFLENISYDTWNTWNEGFIKNKYNNLDLRGKLEDTYNYNHFFPKTRKIFKKTRNGVKLNLKTTSFRRDRNLSFKNLYLNVTTQKGLKETFLKFWNISINKFIYEYTAEDETFFLMHPKYYYYYYFSKEEKLYNMDAQLYILNITKEKYKNRPRKRY